MTYPIAVWKRHRGTGADHRYARHELLVDLVDLRNFAARGGAALEWIEYHDRIAYRTTGGIAHLDVDSACQRTGSTEQQAGR